MSSEPSRGSEMIHLYTFNTLHEILIVNQTRQSTDAYVLTFFGK